MKVNQQVTVYTSKMKSSPFLLSIRAISAEFARRIFIPVVIILAVALVALLALGGWLITVNAWWWLLFVPIIVVTLLSVTAAAVAGYALQFLRPAQTKVQKQSVRAFVDELQEASDMVQTPKLILFMRLIKDTFFPSEKGIVNEVASRATSLRPRFEAVVASFK